MAVTIKGSNVVFSDSSVQTVASFFFRTRTFSTSRTYTVPSDVRSIYVFAWGATGGQNTAAAKGGVGGAGYAELFIASPAASYTVTIGAAGSTSGTAGGTTSFGAISITGSGGVTGGSGSAGGVATGGGFNANGGAGGTSSASGVGAGGGGSGSRAGNGYAGAANSNPFAAVAGGGTGGAASGNTPGIAATSASGSALVLPFGALAISFYPGAAGNTDSCAGNSYGGTGATGQFIFDATNPGISTFLGPGVGAYGGQPYTAYAGASGLIQVVEICKV